MAKTGRSSKPGPKPKIIDWDMFDKLCEIQCTQSEIAHCFDISVDTLQRRIAEEKGDFAAYYEQKKDAGKRSLRRKMFEVASTGNVTMLIWLSKNWLNFTDKTEEIIKPDPNRNIAIKELADKLTHLTQMNNDK